MLVCRLHSWPRPMARLRRTTSKKLVKGAHLLRRLGRFGHLGHRGRSKKSTQSRLSESRISLAVRTALLLFYGPVFVSSYCCNYGLVAVCRVTSFWKLSTKVGIRLGAAAVASFTRSGCDPDHACRRACTIVMVRRLGLTLPAFVETKHSNPFVMMVTVDQGDLR